MNRSVCCVVALCFGFLVWSAEGGDFPTESDWKYLKGVTEASPASPAAWREPGFDDSQWLTGSAPFFYGETLTGTELSDMRGGYTSVYLRKTFLVDDPAAVTRLDFGALADDGFVAWINGREIVRYNVPAGDLAYNSTATAALAEPIPFNSYEIANPTAILVPGVNVVAVHAFNLSLADSSDFVFDASLSVAADSEAPEIDAAVPPPGSTIPELLSVEIRFTERVFGVDAADLLINGLPATNVNEVAAGTFVFTFPPPLEGNVSVAWRADHGIVDFSRNPFAGGQWTYVIDPEAGNALVILSEFMANNRLTLLDEDRDTSDWIELFNSGTSEVRLGGWFLTDTTNNYAKWRFPDVTLAGRGRLIVFASEKNKTNLTGRLHTNFKLSDSGEYLALVSPRTNVVSEFAPVFPRQLADVAYGRVEGAPEITGFFAAPTPGAPNASSGPGFSPEVRFSRMSGTYTGSFDLMLTTEVANAVIRYSLNGTMPSNTSPVFSAPLRITNSIQVRARSFQDGLLPGPPRSETFLLLSNNVVNFTSTLPVLIIHSMGVSPVSSTQRFSHISLYEPAYGVTTLTNQPTFATRGAVKIRGSSTEGLSKQSFAMEFWDEFNLDDDKSILGLPSESDWVLYAPNIYEPVLIHNPFIHQLSRDMGRYSSRTRFIEVFLNRTAGSQVSSLTYNGIYVLEEKIKIGKDRVDIDKLEPEHATTPEVTGGYLMKVDRVDPGDTGFTPYGGPNILYLDPKEPEIERLQRDPQEQYIRGYLNAFGRSLTNSATWRDPQIGYPAYIDVDAWIDFHVLEVLSGNVDSLVLSTYLHKPRNGKITYGPHWDFDRALGSTDGRDANPRNWSTGPFFTPPWWGKLFTDYDFWQKWIDRWQELRQSHFSITNLHRLIDSQANEVREAQPRERKRWGVVPRGGSYQGEVNLMKNWLSNRVSYFDGQLAQPPKLSAPAGKIESGSIITISGPPTATVFYTLDGSDPRRAGTTNPAPNALVYSGPIQINGNARIVARSRDTTKRQVGGPPRTTPWSGPAIATYVVRMPTLLITEVMFHPADPPSGSTNSAPDFEFVELKNSGDEPLALPGIHFASGIEFRFSATNNITMLAPGERLVIVRNRAAFSSRYPTVKNIAGEFQGNLRNSGNRLTLLGPLEEPISDFEYRDDWAVLADGFGFSLVLADEVIAFDALGDPSHWRLSARAGGSPGLPDPTPFTLSRVLINEVLAHSDPPFVDTIELYNPGTTRADISGWYLTDAYRNPRKYRFGPDTFVPAQGFFLIDENSFGGAVANAFSLSSLGDDVYLFSADEAGELTGYVHGFDFGASANGVTFGRIEDGGGAEHFVPQTRMSFTQANSGPRIGPIVISEVMYEPPPIGTANNLVQEFVELLNLTDNPIPLYDPAYPTNAWRLRGGVDFDFPAGAILRNSSAAIVVSFNPRTDRAALGQFRARYALDESVTVFGPWRGALDNKGDSIRLLRPDAPQTAPSPDAGFVPYIVVDQVDYLASVRWPAEAAATGLSLVREPATAFGNDAANWRAAAPSAGDLDRDGDGLPDRWEARHGLDWTSTAGIHGAEGDADGDGLSNAQELRAGTHPLDAASALELRAVRDASGSVRLEFTAKPGRSYLLRFRNGVDGSDWLVLRRVNPLPDPADIAVTDAPGVTARFYRLELD